MRTSGVLEPHVDIGNKHLSTALMHLMILAFLVDQIQLCCIGAYVLDDIDGTQRPWTIFRQALTAR